MNSKFKLSQVKKINAEEGTIDFVLTERVVDHDGEVVEPQGAMLENFTKNPVFLWAHDLNHPPLGHILPESIQVGRQRITGTVNFDMQDPFAAMIFHKYQRGDLNAGSIRFLPIEVDEAPVLEGQTGPTFKKYHILEFSAVPVPANPMALKRSIEKGVDDCDGFDCYYDLLKSFTNKVDEPTPEAWVKMLNDNGKVDTKSNEDSKILIAELRSRAKHLELLKLTDGLKIEDSEKKLLEDALTAINKLLEQKRIHSVSNQTMRIENDEENEILTINGMKYSYDMFRSFGIAGLPIDSKFKIINRNDGVITLEIIETGETGTNNKQSELELLESFLDDEFINEVRRNLDG